MEADPETFARMRAVLADAAMAFPDVPGVEVVDEGDLVRSMAPGRPQPYVNVIARLDLEAPTLTARVRAIEGPYRAAGLPTSWWVDQATRPADAAERLADVGLRHAGGEAVMVLDLATTPHGGPDGRDGATTRRVTTDALSVRVVERLSDLDEWIAVMAASYGWSDPAKASVMRGLYDPRSAHGSNGRRIHVLARADGVAVGGASLFPAAGQGWVTNVGTIPAARGRGVGAAVTAATLVIAAERGDPTAWLAASEMGEPVYRRLGFRTVGRLEHFLGPAHGH